ncbi:MAG: universal stress protein [Acidimicrobiia bacterium]|nr:universal stress protein [Acidimicrobiia bacterium]
MSALYERTVIPVDGSKLAEMAIDAVYPIVRAQHGALTLVMVLDGHVDHALGDYAEAEGISVMEAAESYLDGLDKDLSNRGVETTSRLVFDPVAASGILDVADAVDATALVIASHGRSGVGRWVMGSVAQKIVQAAKLPTLVIPAR